MADMWLVALGKGVLAGQDLCVVIGLSDKNVEGCVSEFEVYEKEDQEV